jgi:solute carrier family 25 carnitine/acylcarnitine transporter 20/29
MTTISPNNKKFQNIRNNKHLNEISCSMITGIVKVCVIQPFDFLRYRIQTSKEININIRLLIRKLISKEGFQVFLKGVNMTSFGVFMSSFIQFSLYQEFFHIISRKGYFRNDFVDLKKLNNSEQKKRINKLSLLCAMSGLLSGIGMATLITPVDNIRIKLQAVQNLQSKGTEMVKYRYKGSADLIKYIYTNEGMKGFYVAFPVSVLREAVASVIYFGTFEYLKNRDKLIHKQEKIKIRNSFFYGAFAGAMNWILTLPIDVVKTKLISDTIIPDNKHYNGPIDCANKIYESNGMKGFYQGISVVLTRAMIVNGVVLTSFDLCRTRLNNN